MNPSLSGKNWKVFKKTDMKRLLLGLALTIICNTGFTQAKISSIKYHDKGNDGDYGFPIFVFADKSTSKKINDYLQVTELLNTAKKLTPAQLFADIKFIPGESGRSGITEMGYEIPLNTSKLLSVIILGETLGAYPSPFRNWYNFNAQNGELIVTEDLCTADGIKKLRATLISRRQAVIKKALDDIKKDKDANEDFDWVKSSLESCNEEADEQYFTLQTDKIIFHKPGCLPHAIMGLEPDLDITLAFQELQPMLSSFGAKALMQKETVINNEKLPGIKKPLYGTIDKYPIVMQFHQFYDKTVMGSYYYISKGISIEISGSISGNDIELAESDKNGDKTAEFKGKITGNTITGTWTDIKTKKQLPFSVKN